jgi:hypothetical protein
MLKDIYFYKFLYFYKLKASASCDNGLKKTVTYIIQKHLQISLFIITNYAQCNSGTFSSK